MMTKTDKNLIPNSVNPSPDYYCTWQTQLYATNGGTPEEQRAIIGEKTLFEKEKPYGWAYFYKEAQKDLFIVMDDSWDVPVKDDSSYYGSLILNNEKFPNSTSETKNNTEALKKLTERIKQIGWKGVGGWVCAQESKKFAGNLSDEEYWSEKMKEAQQSGFAYWKVDWGEKAENAEFRKMLTEKAKEIAPDLVIEHAVTNKAIPHSDVFRTYDVPALMSIPMTMNKLADIFLNISDEEPTARGLINCEDEVYMAAAGGFTMGVMRHPYIGAFPDGKADRSFPDIHRRIKTKMFEVIRAAKWHRTAPAFGIQETPASVSERKLCDWWSFEKKEDEIELWWFKTQLIADSIKDNILTKYAPAQLVRNCKFADVQPDSEENIPYIVASKNPNGAFSVATLGRTLNRTYKIPLCDICIETGEAELIGVFGEYKSLTVITDFENIKSVLMQDMAGDTAYDVTEEVSIENGRIVFSGNLIHDIGTEVQPKEDTSEPGAVIKLIVD